ncbi:MAG: hypothetical protein ACRC0X_07555, partial [Brevinema sp.]
ELFWQYIANNLPISQVLSIREAAGKNKDEVLNKTVDDKIFIPSHIGIDKISLSFEDNAKDVIPSEGKDRIKILYLYCNYLGSNFSDIKITSTFRSAERQVEIMIRDYFSVGKWGLYGYSETIYKNIMNDESLTLEQKNKKAYDELLKNVKAQDHVENTPGFPHCNPNICAVDTATWDSNVNKAIITFRKNGTFLKSSSLHFREKGEKANHLILTGLRPTSTI